MTTNAFHLQIISPAKVVMDTHVPSAEVPGLEGDFGVLPGHAAFFSMLRPGVIEVKMSDGVRRRFFAASGYADVTPEHCTVISDHVQDLAEISVNEVEEALAAAKAALASADNDTDRSAAEKVLYSTEVLLSAVRA